MKKNRYLPFGYQIREGEVCIQEAEATVVQGIFGNYQEGLSYKKISENLTIEAVPYIENRTDWNKHIIKRILENPRYCGGDNFPQIVTRETFKAVATLIGQKNRGKPLSKELDIIRSKGICGDCGAKYIRDGRNKKYEAWCCSEEGRIAQKRITDQTLLKEVTGILNAIIDDPSQLKLLEQNKSNYSLTVDRMENQINRELEKRELDSDYIKLLIFACATEKYETCSDQEYEYLTQQLLEIFEQQIRLDTISVELFEDTVKQVVIDSKGTLWLQMINGKLIGKE